MVEGWGHENLTNSEVETEFSKFNLEKDRDYAGKILFKQSSYRRYLVQNKSFEILRFENFQFYTFANFVSQKAM